VKPYQRSYAAPEVDRKKFREPRTEE
jgi:hypothetical protein